MAQVASATPGKASVYIIFYSMYGHVYELAKQMKEGVDSIDGCEGLLYQVQETLPTEVLEKMHAAPKPDIPVIDVVQLPEADGFLFGFPTRFGSMPAQMKAFFDATGGLWYQKKLYGKPAGLFTSTTASSGGQEFTIISSLGPIVHHGMVFVPPGYSYDNMPSAEGPTQAGSCWGAATFAGANGSRQPSENELGMAKHQGAEFAKVAKKLKAAA